MANELKPAPHAQPAVEPAVETLADLSAPMSFSLPREVAMNAASRGQEAPAGVGQEMLRIQVDAVRSLASQFVKETLMREGDPLKFTAAAEIGSVGFPGKLKLAA